MYHMYQVKKETVSMYTRDRVRLDADIYRPESKENLPVLLMRQPYGREIASTVVYAHPRWYASQGYIVVIQDVRGRGTSEGEFELFQQEVEDGHDTLNWASQLEGSNGEIGMYGFSYQGMSQLYAAATHHSALKTICPSMIAYDLYTDWAYENGAFCLAINLAWAVQLAAETARLKQDFTAYKFLYTASDNLPFSDTPSVFQEILAKYAPSNFYYQWLNHPENDQYWQQLSPYTYLDDVDLPMLHIGGWFDPYLRGTINLYQQIHKRSQFPQYLIIGPWGHLPWGNKLGDRYYGQQGNSPVDEIQIAWFNKFLKGIDSEIFNNPPVCLFEMGSNQWRFFDMFPGQNQKIYTLNSTGLASIRTDNGKLVAQEKKIFPSQDILVHDPWRPVPSLGGHAAIPAGSFERSQLDNRSDILTYTSEFLAEDLHIAGVIEVEINCSAETPTFDLCAVVSEVFPDGRVYNFTQGYVSIKQPQIPVKFSLQPTCIKISQGNAIRLSLSAACFPAYPVNYGKRDLVIDAQIITLSVNSAEKLKSQLLLSII